MQARDGEWGYGLVSMNDTIVTGTCGLQEEARTHTPPWTLAHVAGAAMHRGLKSAPAMHTAAAHCTLSWSGGKGGGGRSGRARKKGHQLAQHVSSGKTLVSPPLDTWRDGLSGAMVPSSSTGQSTVQAWQPPTAAGQAAEPGKGPGVGRDDTMGAPQDAACKVGTASKQRGHRQSVRDAHTSPAGACAACPSSTVSHAGWVHTNRGSAPVRDVQL
jgi:hypothetical protein